MNLPGFTIFLFSLFIITQANNYRDSEEYKEFQEFKEFEEFKKWKKEKELTQGESKSLEEQSSLRKGLEKNRDEDNSDEKWKYKKSKENHKNVYKKNYSKEDDYYDEGKKSYKVKNDGKRNYEEKKKYERKDDGQKKKYEKFNNMNHFEKIIQVEENNDDPPPINEAALMARYIVNQANWTSVATISSRKDIRSYPSANVISFGDGILGSGSGIPYMYLTPLDFTAQDINKDNRATLLMTLAQGRYCHTKNYDPMDPRCARVILTGKIKRVDINSTEIVIAEKAVFSRHPWLQNMPADHHFFFAKLKIASIAVLDTFGGPKFVPIKDYLHPPTPNITDEFSRLKLLDSNIISDELGSDIDPYVTLV